MLNEEFWLAKDKDGTVHLANIKLVKPSHLYKENPNANDNIFIPPHTGYTANGNPIFSILVNGQLPIPDDLTFENSPRKIKQLILE